MFTCACFHVQSIHFQEPQIDRCSMVEVEHYDVMINSNNSETSQMMSYTTTLFYEYLGNDSIITLTVTIVVIDANGQRSNSTVTMKKFYMINSK